MEQLTKNQAVATSQEAVQNQNEPQLRDENAHNDKSVHGVLNPTYQAGLRRDAVQPDIEAERKKRDEIEAGKSYCSRRFGGATCDDKSAQIYARFDKNDWRLNFFVQAEDGIRDLIVTGVQTCALPISATQLPSEPTRAVGERTIVRISSSDIEAISTRVAPLSAIKRSQTRSIGSTPRSAASAAMVFPACCGWFGEIETCTASHDGMRPQLLRPLSAISASMRARLSGRASRANIALLSPTCTQGGSRFLSGLAPAI